MQALYSRNKTFLLEHAFSEIFTPRRTLQPDYDPDLSKTEVDAYGHLVEVFFKKHQASQPPDHVVSMHRMQSIFMGCHQCQKS